MTKAPELRQIEANRERLGDRVRATPVWQWTSDRLARELGAETGVWLKLELFQHAGSFKTRGALTNMLALPPADLARGVTAVSAGNHALAVAYAARALGTSAKVVMLETSNPARVAGCRALGAELELIGNVHDAFARTEEIERDEGRHFVHPFEGPQVALGTASVGLELMREVPDLDAVVVPIGGGGLCAGVATAVKAIAPRCRVIGVEPEGADSMHRSFAAGKPMSIEAVNTIADSLGAPYAMEYSFGLCREFVDELVKIDDDEICRAMALLFGEMKLAVEPAGAATTAALRGPLREALRGKRVGLIVCGANIDPENFAAYLARGAPAQSVD